MYRLGFDANAVRESFAVPQDFKPMAAIALGHQGDSIHLDTDFQSIELAKRKRKPLADIAFMGMWGNR